MSALFLLVGISLFVALGFLAAFIWSVKNGQYEDDYTPSVRMLFENEVLAKQKIKLKENYDNKKIKKSKLAKKQK
jgi:cbb3-type cytochrome oxidase maturation protein